MSKVLLIEKNRDLHRHIRFDVVDLDSNIATLLEVFPLVDGKGANKVLYAVTISIPKKFSSKKRYDAIALFGGERQSGYLEMTWCKGEIDFGFDLDAKLKFIILICLLESENLPHCLQFLVPNLTNEIGAIPLNPITDNRTFTTDEFGQILAKYGKNR